MRVAAKPLVALRKLRHALGGVCLGLAASLLPTGAALAEKGLPKPYVSPALDAVLLPITAEVRKAFRLGKKAAGVVVVSVDPGGTGELYGLEPGEVVTKLDGLTGTKPGQVHYPRTQTHTDPTDPIGSGSPHRMLSQWTVSNGIAPVSSCGCKAV